MLRDIVHWLPTAIAYRLALLLLVKLTRIKGSFRQSLDLLFPTFW